MSKKVEVRGEMSRAQLASYLRDLASTVESGKVCIQDGDSYVMLTPGDTVAVEVAASQKMEKGKLELGVAWKIESEEKKDIALVISGTEPTMDGAGVEENSSGE